MKTAVSIPDQVFEDAARLAKRLKSSRGRLFSRALAEIVTRLEDVAETEALHRAWEEVGDESANFRRIAARKSLERSEW